MPPRDARGKFVKVELVAEVGGFVKGFRRAAAIVGRFAKGALGAFRRIAGGVSRLIFSFGGLATAITAAFSVRAVIRGAAEISDALGRLESFGVMKLGVLRKAAVDFSNQWAVSVKDFLLGAGDIKSGINTLTDEGVAAFTEFAALTSVATGASVQEMTKLFALMFGIFGKTEKGLSELQIAEKFGAMISAAVNIFRTEGSEMVGAISALGATATAAGIPIEEQIAVLGRLQSVMKSGVLGGTAFKVFVQGTSKAIAEMNKRAAKGNVKMGALAKAFVKANGDVQTTPELIDALNESLGGLTKPERANVISELFGGGDAAKVVDALIGGTDDLRKEIVQIRDAGKEGRSFILKMANAIQNRLGKQISRLGNTIAGVADAAFQFAVPGLTKIIDAVGDKFVALQVVIEKWAGDNKETIEKWAKDILQFINNISAEDIWNKVSKNAEIAINAFKRLWDAVFPIAKVVVEWIALNPRSAGIIALLAAFAPTILSAVTAMASLVTAFGALAGGGGVAVGIKGIIALFTGPAGLATLVTAVGLGIGIWIGKIKTVQDRIVKLIEKLEIFEKPEVSDLPSTEAEKKAFAAKQRQEGLKAAARRPPGPPAVQPPTGAPQQQRKKGGFRFVDVVDGVGIIKTIEDLDQSSKAFAGQVESILEAIDAFPKDPAEFQKISDFVGQLSSITKEPGGIAGIGVAKDVSDFRERMIDAVSKGFVQARDAAQEIVEREAPLKGALEIKQDIKVLAEVDKKVLFEIIEQGVNEGELNLDLIPQGAGAP